MRDTNDIENFIQLKVHDHVSEVPPHIWDNIQTKRSYPYTILNFFRARWRTTSLVVGLLGLLLMMVYQQQGDQNMATQMQYSEGNEEGSLMINEESKTYANNGIYAITAFEGRAIGEQIQNKSESTIEGNKNHSKKELSTLLTNKESTQSSDTHTFSNTANPNHSSNQLLVNKASLTKNTSNHPNSGFEKRTALQNQNEASNQFNESKKLMDLDDNWVGSAYSGKDRNRKQTYPHGPSIKYFQAIPENDYRNLSVNDLPKELEIIPMQENILQVKDATTEKNEVESKEMAESLLKNRIGERKEKSKEKKTPPRKPKKKKKQWLWLDLVTAPSYIIKNLDSYNGSLKDNEYVNKRLETEQSRFGYTFGLRASFRLHDVSEIRTGILYSRITENFVYQREPETNPITGEEISFPLETAKNKYEFVDIPILVGYREDRKEFDFNMNFGILLNLAFSQKGRMVDYNSMGSIDLQGSSDAPIFNTHSGLALYSSIGYNYKFSDKVHLLVEPSLKYVVRPINNWEFNPVKQRFHSFGLTTGIRVNIGR